MAKGITPQQQLAAAHVRDVARSKGMGRGQIAAAAGVDPSTVGDFLNGHRWPLLSKREAILGVLGLTADEVDRVAEGRDTEEGPNGGFMGGVSGERGTVPIKVVGEERGELSGQRVVRVHIATMAHDIDIQTSLADDEDRASVIAEIMGTLGLEGDASRGGSRDEGSQL